jgi:hypothetical protein
MPYQPSKAERLTKAQAEAFLEANREFDCEYGHLGDSTYDGGPCLDEVLHRFPELDEEGA